MKTKQSKTVNRIKHMVDSENGTGVSSEAAPTQRIVIDASTYERVVYRLDGVTPLMLGAWCEDSIRQLPDHPDRKPIKKGGTRSVVDPRAVVSGKCYNHPDGGYALPITMIFKALQTAGSDFTVPGSRRSVSTVIKRNLLVIGDSKDGQWVRLLPKVTADIRVAVSGSASGSKGYVIDERVGRNSGMTRSPRMIYRPRFDTWSVVVAIEYNTLWFDLSSVTNIMAIAGKTVGFGEWRPEKGGSFGRFVVTHNE